MMLQQTRMPMVRFTFSDDVLYNTFVTHSVFCGNGPGVVKMRGGNLTPADRSVELTDYNTKEERDSLTQVAQSLDAKVEQLI